MKGGTVALLFWCFKRKKQSLTQISLIIVVPTQSLSHSTTVAFFKLRSSHTSSNSVARTLAHSLSLSLGFSISMASSSRMSCFQCQDSSSSPDHFRNGWRLRSGEHAQLCPRCAWVNHQHTLTKTSLTVFFFFFLFLAR